MQVYKFGGASVKDAKGVNNLYNIISSNNQKLIVVISAMGKTTNKLEEITSLYVNGEPFSDNLNELIAYHEEIINGLQIVDKDSLKNYGHIVNFIIRKITII